VSGILSLDLEHGHYIILDNAFDHVTTLAIYASLISRSLIIQYKDDSVVSYHNVDVIVDGV